jgi:hypothetical protein
VIIPERVGLAVTNGAVIFGLLSRNPGRNVFASRKARFTYGTNTFLPYEPGNPRHIGLPTHISEGNGKKFVTKTRFRTIVKEGTTMECDQKFDSGTFTASHADLRVITFDIYASTSPDIYFLDDSTAATKIGTITVPVRGAKDIVALNLQFGSTEIMVTAENKSTGQKADAKLEYSFGSV